MRLKILFIIVTLLSCKKESTDPIIEIGENGLFSFKVEPEGDGLVTFVADSSQNIKEYIWDFGDGSALSSTISHKTSHTFTKNTDFHVKLTAKNKDNHVSETKTIEINTRLARTFANLPVSERNTLNVLHIITGRSILNFDVQNEMEHLPFDILNFTFQDHIKHHYLVHEKELDNLNFNHHYLKLTKEDSSYISENPKIFNINTFEGYGFLRNNFKNENERVIATKILETKKKVAASLLVFWVNSTDLGAVAYAKLNSSIAVINLNGRGTGFLYRINGKNPNSMRSFYELSHELAHCLDIPHDPVSNYTYFLMTDGGNSIDYKNEKQNTNFPPLRLFQSKGYKQNFMRFDNNTFYDPKFSEVWVRSEFSNSAVVNKMHSIGEIAIEGAMTSGNETFFNSIRQHLIYQHNIKLVPGKIKMIDDDLNILNINNYRQAEPKIIKD